MKYTGRSSDIIISTESKKLRWFGHSTAGPDSGIESNPDRVHGHNRRTGARNIARATRCKVGPRDVMERMHRVCAPEFAAMSRAGEHRVRLE